MKKRKLLISLVFSMALTSLPTSIFAMESNRASESMVSWNVNDSIIENSEDNACINPNSLMWRLNGNTLTISGTDSIDSFFLENNNITNEKIEKIIIEPGVTSIGEGAFEGCSSLTSITIPGSVTSIGKEAFNVCTGLTNITIPDSVTSIGDWAFRECLSLTNITIPNSVTRIGKGTFEGCSSLTSITIPDSVTSIGDRAFRNSGLINITIPNSVTSIGENVFSYCSSLTNITIPDSVTSIGENVFRNCSSLTSITIPGSVTSIGKETFRNCGNLANITIPDSVTSIGDWAFRECLSLTNITIPNSVTRIGKGAFEGCSSLTGITIPNSVTSIGDRAFEECRNLKIYYDDSYYRWNLITNVASIPNYVSVDHVNIPWKIEGTTLTISGTETNIPFYFWEEYGLEGERIDKIIIEPGITSIGESAFRNCGGISNVILPDGVTDIGKYAFSGCKGLTNITIPDSVTSIGEGAFENSGLISITIPNSVTSIGKEAFEYCFSLKNIYYGGSKEEWIKICPDGLKIATMHYKLKDQNIKFQYGSKLIGIVDAKLTKSITGIKTTATFSSSNPTVAKIGKNSGIIICQKVGETVITVKAVGNSKYKEAREQATLHVFPKTAEIKSVKSAEKGQIVLKSTNATRGNDGYQIQYKYNGKTKKNNVKSNGNLKKIFRNLKSGKSFKVRVRAYKIVGNKLYFGYYSKWKIVKKIK